MKLPPLILLKFPRLQLKFTIPLIIAAFCVAASADVIRLKNGKTIVADSTHESNGRIEYTIGDNTFAIPKELVDAIDARPAEKIAPPAPVVDIPPVHEDVETPQELVSKVIHGGHIDETAIQSIEKEGVPEKSAAANFLAALLAERQSNLDVAARYYLAALHYEPNQPVMLEHYAAVLLQLHRNAEAVSYAEQAVRYNPKSAESLGLLGYAYYQNNRSADAIAAWKKSLALHPDPKVEELLARAERESSAEADFREQESSHFVLHFEGSQASDPLRNGILRVLEQQYNTLQNDLGSSPRSISVSLYTDRVFFDVTRAPTWTAALNDGKIRIPISGLTEVTTSLAGVLRHELTHSFVAEITHGRAPTWLNEGVAQLEEPRSTAPVGARLAALYASGNQIPLNRLDRSFQSENEDEVAVAYAEALAAAECIRVNYGISDLARILKRLGEGEQIESALRNTIHSGYAQLESELTDYLKKTYQ